MGLDSSWVGIIVVALAIFVVAMFVSALRTPQRARARRVETGAPEPQPRAASRKSFILPMSPELEKADSLYTPPAMNEHRRREPGFRANELVSTEAFEEIPTKRRPPRAPNRDAMPRLAIPTDAPMWPDPLVQSVRRSR
jgi:hypothetical protein